MAIISRETWSKFTEEEKKAVLDNYRCPMSGSFYDEGFINAFKILFGSKNMLMEPAGDVNDNERIKRNQDEKWNELSEDDKTYYHMLYLDLATSDVVKNHLVKVFGEDNLKGEIQMNIQV